ncbi:penicillin acylase family protein [Solirhodobacter olei]|uniref:penicillin acylase family protein n=1 Tax=Solirhodobacter olei TaxID=2493082 RepID=UPI000FD8B4D1|nr:penicillin acylase family protein [Solirhodobacter olei]
MIILFRWLLRLFTGIVILAVAAGALAYYFLSRSLPDYNASYAVAGINAPMQIVRTNADVPHIFGQTDADSFYGLGFAHAQDRLWQMTMMRRTAEGRLSELFGKRTEKIDELMRRLDFYGLAQKSLAAQDPETRQALEAYAAGVNAWIHIVNTHALGRGAPQFFLFSNRIAVWTPADSLAILKLMSMQISSGLEKEVLRARLSLILPPARVQDIMPTDPQDPVAALPNYASLFPKVQKSYAALDISPDPLSPVKDRAFLGASNAFAAAPARSAAGGSLLANDPHLGFQAPTLWYLARLHLKSGDVIGATIPGMPVVLLGRSDKLGWGLTTTGLDDQDLHIEQVNPKDPTEYKTPDGWKPFVTRKSIIRIKGAAPKTLTLRWTDNGPVLPGSLYNLGEITPPGDVMSLSWTALSPDDTSMTAAIHLMMSQNIDQALKAGSLYIAPAQNLMLADKHGIAMQVIGRMPKRDARNTTQGRMPNQGWLPQNRWLGMYPYSDNPRFVDPASGILLNTNNKVVDRPFPNNLTFDWGDTQRIQRLLKLMKSRDVQTRESFIEAQLDTVSPTARHLLPLIARNLWYEGEQAPAGTPKAMRQKALALLANWNGDMNEHMPEPLIYATWMWFLQDRIIRDELGPLADSFRHLDPIFIERVFRNTDGAAVWCDVKQSTKVESCDDVAKMSLDDALLWLKQRYGPNIESWRWGDAHQAAHDDPVLGKIPVLRYFVNIRQSVSGGDNTLDRGVSKGFGPDPFLDVHGPGYRGVYDFADPDSSVFITATGQSGQPLSRFYDNLGELWRRGEYIPMSLDPGLARAGAIGITHLRPEKSGG